MKIESRLFQLSKWNADSNYVNKQLYRLLYSKDLYVMAYENIKSNKGVLTPGISPYSMDGVSMERIERLIKSLRNESYRPKPCRRILIPKMNGKKRPLGLPDADDKLVQEAVRIILECIYDSSEGATFSKQSFGFRKGLGCHHALREVYTQFRKSTWIIKADIKGFFDNVDHLVLITLLRKRIRDERFIRLIWKFLRAGFVWEGNYHKTSKGTPQGGLISPILANIYLHEFDEFVERLKHEQGTETVPCKDYNLLRQQYRRGSKRLLKLDLDHPDRQELIQKNKHLEDEVYSMPSRSLKDPTKAVIRYVRYADDWVISIKGSKRVAESIYSQCKNFYDDELRLSWNMEKSKLIRSKDEDVEFLGTLLRFNTAKSQKMIYVVVNGTRCKKRSRGVNDLTLNLPKKQILDRLKNRGFLSYNRVGVLKAKHHSRLMTLSDYEILKRYRSILLGLKNYYSFVNNIHEMGHIQYLLGNSLVKTLAGKHKTRSRKIWAKYGKRITILREDGKKSISFISKEGYKRKVMNFKTSVIRTDWQPRLLPAWKRSKSLLTTTGCSICEQPRGKIEMHHVRHIRKADIKYDGFHKVMGYANRKQIPVCKGCHQDIHKGRYDGVPLRELAKHITIKLELMKSD